MFELYFINVLGKISGFCEFLIIAFSVVYIIMLLFLPLVIEKYEDYTYYKEETKKRYKKYFKRFCYFLLCILVGFLFIPSKKQLYEIYGVGTVIDYVQSNEKAKQLPDKAIEALTLYLDEKTKENGGK